MLFKQALKEPKTADLDGVRLALVGDKAPPQVPTGEIEKFLDRAEKNALQEVRKSLDAFVANNADKQPRAHQVPAGDAVAQSFG